MNTPIHDELFEETYGPEPTTKWSINEIGIAVAVFLFVASLVILGLVSK